MLSPTKVMLIACGSFSPPTPMHLRMFEIARDHFREQGTHEAIGGIVSPVHDLYSKNGLIAAKHRCAMVKLALQTSDWIRLSDWECNEQNQWTRSRISLQYHQNYINSLLNDKNGTVNEKLPGWIPPNIKKYKGERVQIKLLCGADLLQSFSVPGLWADEDLEGILGEHGLVVITRAGTDPDRFVFESDLLTRFRKNITIVTNWVPNEVSSTMARRHLSRGLSVKYMLDDIVVDYIKQNNLFGVQSTEGESTATTADGEPQLTLSNGHPKSSSETMTSTTNGDCESTTAKSTRAVKRVTDINGTCIIDTEDEVGQCKISTITLSPANRTLQRRIEYLSDNQLDKICGAYVSDDDILDDDDDDDSEDDLDDVLDTLSVEGMPATTSRSQNDLIQFVFTSHGIRVISDKEYVV